MSKKGIERIYFDSFVEKIGVKPFEIIESESPDFVFHTEAGLRIGVELTRLYRESAPGQPLLKEQESLRERVTRRACELYSERGHPPVHMSVHFSNANPIRKADVYPLAEQLVTLAVRNLPEVGASRDEEYLWSNRTYFPEAVDVVMLFRPASLKEAHFGAPSVSFLNEYSSDFVARRIADKEARVSDYLQVCDSVWLVLCSGGDMLASVVELDQHALARTYHSVFKRVFWYRWPMQVTELRIEKFT